MSQNLSSAYCCCSPCDETITVTIPGPQGEPGTPGTSGGDGVSAFTELTDVFVVPPINLSTVAQVLDSTAFAIGQDVYLQSAGYFRVTSHPTAISMGLQNLGSPGNIIAGSNMPPGQQISPAGPPGPSGAALMPGVFFANTLVDARAIPTDPTNLFLFMIGGVAVNDGAGGDFYADHSNNDVDDDGATTIEPNDAPAMFRWKRRL